MLDQSNIAPQLAHVLWIAGSPCSGKSTISHTITRIYVFLDYHADAWASNHFARRVAAGDPEATAFLKMNMDQRRILSRLCRTIPIQSASSHLAGSDRRLLRAGKKTKTG